MLIDRLGAVRLIGLCVDAALHGVPAGRLDHDRQDLGGLLYCALTATWPGPSDSIVPAAPHAHDEVLAPRQVRAGVPRPLDLLWTDITETGHHKQQRRWSTNNHHDDVATAHAVQDRLMEFLGDPTGLTEALAGSIPPINEIRPVVLPQVPEMTVRDFERPAPPLEPDPPRGRRTATIRRSRRSPTSSTSRPRRGCRSSATRTTRWRGCGRAACRHRHHRRSTSHPSVRCSRRSRRRAARPGDRGPTCRNPRRPGRRRSRPRASGRGTAPARTAAVEQTSEHDAVPGRNWLRLAMVVAACLALLVAVAVAFNLGRGRTPLGAEREEPTRSPSLTTPPEPTASPLPDVVAGAFDPLSTDGTENDADVPLAVDGDPATSWTTSTYRDQLGPVLPALKSGVGLYLDLGVVREVSEVDLDLVGSPTDVELYVTDDVPDGVPTGAPVASDTATGAELTLEPASAEGSRAAVTGRYVVVWFTSLPVVSGGFRAGLAEVVVRGR